MFLKNKLKRWNKCDTCESKRESKGVRVKKERKYMKVEELKDMTKSTFAFLNFLCLGIFLFHISCPYLDPLLVLTNPKLR